MKPAYHSITAMESPRILHAPEPVASLDFLKGAAIAAAPPTPWVFDVEIESADPPHLLGGRIPMASERLLAALSAAGVDNIQAFPAVLRFRGGAEWRHHSVLNVIGLLDAVDLEASVGTILAEGEHGPTLMAFRNLVVARSQTRGLPMFRLFQDPAMLLVDDRLLRVLTTHKPAEGWGFTAFEIEMSDPPETL